MIIELTGATAETVEQAGQDIRALAASWGYEASEHSPPAGSTVTGRTREDRPIDPVSITALVLSIPSAAVSVMSLVDRVQKRRRAKQLIDQAKQLSTVQVTAQLLTADRPVEFVTLTPDELVELLADELH